MIARLPVLLRSAMYAVRGGFLIRPLVIAMILGASGAVLSSLEEAIPGIRAWIPSTLFPSHEDPGVAQVILSSIATSIMTVVSIVFAILLMTLTLASTQFSPRILISFVRDRTTQGTLGIFLGTFAYCMAALPAARALPHPFVPIATVTGAMVLALVCAGWLIYFINHISHSISVNQLWIELRAKLSWLSTSTCPIREVRSSCQIAAKRPRQSTGSPFSIGSPALPLYRYQSPCCPCESLPDLRAFAAPRRSVCAGRRCAHASVEAGARAGRPSAPTDRRLRHGAGAHHAAGR
jgi:hypothetical protein